MFDTKKFYLGTLCKKGHEDYDEGGIGQSTIKSLGSLRLLSNGRCVKCMNEYNKEYNSKKENKIRKKKRDEKYLSNPDNKERKKKLDIKYREEHKKEMKEYSKEYRSKPENKKKAKDNSLKWHYGISLEEYNTLYEKQNGNCKICGEHFDSLYVDHDHVTGKVRGLLCIKCNSAIGLLNEDKTIFQKAINYLEEIEE